MTTIKKRMTKSQKDAVVRHAGDRKVNFYIDKAMTLNGKERYICCWKAEVVK